ncbi:hypothetical protein C2C40_22280 [Escherichia coli]|nr:hypothetical protein [Escherichia coli]EFA4897606.1 hypothetical protein [Escherichia coli]EFB9807711.1 hypothetical protein [Escherichia coli]
MTFSGSFRLRRQHFTAAQRICTTAQCFHIYFGNAGKWQNLFCHFPGLDNEQREASARRPLRPAS